MTSRSTTSRLNGGVAGAAAAAMPGTPAALPAAPSAPGAFVREDVRLADVRRIMAGKPSGQDVFVTRTGTPNEPVIGWVTNVTVTQASVA